MQTREVLLTSAGESTLSGSTSQQGSAPSLKRALSFKHAVLKSERANLKSGRVLPHSTSRLAASHAIVRGNGSYLPALAMIYRLCEFGANVLLLIGFALFVKYQVFIALFTLLWYLPAAYRTGSFVTPLLFPILNFVVDDFSLLSLHPTPRDATDMYLIYFARVALLTSWLVSLYFFSEYSGSVFLWNTLVDTDKITALTTYVYRNMQLEGHYVCSAQLWEGLVVFTFISAVVWLAATIMAFSFFAVKYGSSPYNNVDKARVEQVNHLAVQIYRISQSTSTECRSGLEKLKKQRPTVHLLGRMDVLQPIWTIFTHLVTDCINTFTLFHHGCYVSSFLLASTIVVFLSYAHIATDGSLHRLWNDAKLSWERGLLTGNILGVMRADQSVQAVPALLINVQALPFVATTFYQSFAGVMSIASTTMLIVPFIFQEFDLGIEHEGVITPELYSNASGLQDLAKRLGIDHEDDDSGNVELTTMGGTVASS